ncbi:hypothetical protein HPB47_014991 [Ixodes persulcatus]|uniref:Uncharacterized protein n=1 Tax=Ixodes persulcatus TaxID=34615 RepID=A0AC60QWH1_IXOPE|nr:hypothetical protein HPB47_014991 [Ixodes persulcatus]
MSARYSGSLRPPFGLNKEFVLQHRGCSGPYYATKDKLTTIVGRPPRDKPGEREKLRDVDTLNLARTPVAGGPIEWTRLSVSHIKLSAAVSNRVPRPKRINRAESTSAGLIAAGEAAPGAPRRRGGSLNPCGAAVFVQGSILSARRLRSNKLTQAVQDEEEPVSGGKKPAVQRSATCPAGARAVYPTTRRLGSVKEQRGSARGPPLFAQHFAQTPPRGIERMRTAFRGAAGRARALGTFCLSWTNAGAPSAPPVHAPTPA